MAWAGIALAALPVVMELLGGGDKEQPVTPTPPGAGATTPQYQPTTAKAQQQPAPNPVSQSPTLGEGLGAKSAPAPQAPAPSAPAASGASGSQWGNVAQAAEVGLTLASALGSGGQQAPPMPQLQGGGGFQYQPTTSSQMANRRLRSIYG